MKLAISYAVMVIPFFIVIFCASDRFSKEKLKHIGIAFAITGTCMSIGIKFFGLYAIGRYGVLKGDTALIAAAVLVSVGVVFLGLNHLIAFIRSRRKANKPVQRTGEDARR